MKRFLIPLLAALLLMVQGCTSFDVRDAVPLSEVPEVSDIDHEYLVQVGDTIRVAIRTFDDPRNPDVQMVVVRPDGKAFFDMIEEEILLAGYTPAVIREILNAKYRDIIKNPSISVNLAAFGPRNIYVGGEVRDIRIEHSFQRGMTVARALFAVGYDTYRGDLERIIVLRQGANGEKPLVMQLDLADALTGRDHTQDISLRPNDVVFVPPKGIVQAGDLIAQINALVPLPGITYPVGSTWIMEQWGIGRGPGSGGTGAVTVIPATAPPTTGAAP